MSQMPIGKYIYCTQHTSCGLLSRPVTNTYRQVHLLYRKIMEEVTVKNYQESQMPIGKYIYCTTTNAKLADGSSSQMPIGKYIYCTLMIAMGVTPKDLSQMPIGKYIYCTTRQTLYSVSTIKSQMPIGKYIFCTASTTTLSWSMGRHKCLSASTFTVP